MLLSDKEKDEMTDLTQPQWIRPLQERDPQLAERHLARHQRVLKDGAMTMIVDAVVAHPEGCAAIANSARAAGASEAEINEAVEAAYFCGGTPALVTAVNAFRTE